MELATSGSFRVGFVIDPSPKKLPPRNCLCLINSIHLEHEKKTKKKNSKNDFVIRADQVCAPLKFFGKCFSTLLSCSLLHGRCPFSRSHRDQMGPSSLSLSASQPLSLAASQPAPVLARLPKPCHTWVQKIKEPRGAYNHTAAARAKLPSLLHFLYFSAHVFPRLTTNPPFMCIIGSPRLAGVTALETLGRVFPPPRARLLASFKTSVSFSLCLFVLFLLNCEKPHSRGGEEASSAIALRGQTVNQRRDNCRWGFHL